MFLGATFVVFAVGCPEPPATKGTPESASRSETADSSAETTGGDPTGDSAVTQTGFETEVVDGLGITVLIPGGTFTMGSETTDVAAEGDEFPAHQVTVSSFWIQTAEVTQAQYQQVMGVNPTSFPPCPECPVDTVDWDQARSFAEAVSALTGQPWRLPTEAEWEYAARGGEPYSYSGSADPDVVGWTVQNSGGSAKPGCLLGRNAYGLCDMSGNVFEWCLDWYGPYAADAVVDPLGPKAGTERVLRGGGWRGGAVDARVAGRGRSAPNIAGDLFGFRLVRAD